MMTTAVNAVAVIVVVTLLSKLLARHAIHSRLWGGCKRRTNTQNQMRFTLSRFYVAKPKAHYTLTNKDVVTFDFKLSKPNIFLEIPEGSKWYSVYHTHFTEEMCISLETLSGYWEIGSASFHRPGVWGPLPPKIWTGFGKGFPGTRPATAKILGSEGTRQLYHTLCSVVQDAEVYFSLCSTPLWVRVSYSMASRIPALKEWMVMKVLWIQVRTIFHKNDFWEDHGTCWFFRRFYWMNPPAWVTEFESWSQFAASRVVLSLNYWLGSMTFGMSASYEEYKIVDSPTK
jgi:hypothetical protein